VDVHPEHVLQLEAPVEPVAVALLDARGEVLLSTASEPSAAPGPPPPAGEIPEGATMEELTASVAHRHVAHLRLGVTALQAQDWQEADARFEMALLYNGDDPLLWWIKGLARRLGEDAEGDDRPELANAHFLSPLEPALRAEAYLAQAPEGREPNPLLRRLMPEEFVEVACLLIEHGLPDQAHRWIDEALRHVDLAMLRYLMAYILLQGTRMEMEAAGQVEAARRAQMPPYPSRRLEWEALRVLEARFGSDARIPRG
jgi:hypothetical protein